MQTVTGPDRTPEEEITRMVNEHQLALLRLCFTYLHDRELAKDAVQETFSKANRSLKTFRYDANEKTWLSRIAINCCWDLSRSTWFRHTDRSVTLDMLPEPKVQPSYIQAIDLSDPLVSEKFRDAVQYALNQETACGDSWRMDAFLLTTAPVREASNRWRSPDATVSSASRCQVLNPPS